MELSYIPAKIYSELWYMQNPYILRTTSILRTMAYLEPEAYFEYCQTSTMERFAKNSYVARLKKFLYLQEMELSGSCIKKLLIFSLKKFFLMFQETEPPKKCIIFFLNKSFSYIAGKGIQENIPNFSGNGLSYNEV